MSTVESNQNPLADYTNSEKLKDYSKDWYPKIPSLVESIRAIANAESDIAQCLACFLCYELLPSIKCVKDIAEQAELTNRILCSYSFKEKAMAELIESLAKLEEADRAPIGCK